MERVQRECPDEYKKACESAVPAAKLAVEGSIMNSLGNDKLTSPVKKRRVESAFNQASA